MRKPAGNAIMNNSRMMCSHRLDVFIMMACLRDITIVKSNVVPGNCLIPDSNTRALIVCYMLGIVQLITLPYVGLRNEHHVSLVCKRCGSNRP